MALVRANIQVFWSSIVCVVRHHMTLCGWAYLWLDHMNDIIRLIT